MSWKAAKWAAKVKTGSTRRKALLQALANYADEVGICWPSQELLADDTEMSVDSVQRHSKALDEMKIIRRTLMPKRRGQFGYYVYELAMPWGLDDPAAHDLRLGHTANQAPAAPQSLRQKPTNKSTFEPSAAQRSAAEVKKAAEARLRAFQAKQEPVESIQNRIAQRIGDDGWLVLGDMRDIQRERITNLERAGSLDDETLCRAVLIVRSFTQPKVSSGG